MRPFVLIVCLTAAACGNQGPESPLSPAAVPAVAATQTAVKDGAGLPFSGAFSADTRAEFPEPGVLVIHFDGDGLATHLGRFELTGVDAGRFPEPVARGNWVFTAANGDQLFAATESRAEPAPPGTDRVTVSGTISGGTGRFAAAGGSFSALLAGTHDESTATGSISGSFEGRLDLNR